MENKYLTDGTPGSHEIISDNVLVEDQTGRVVAVFYNDYDLDDVVSGLKELEDIKEKIKHARDIAYNSPELNLSNFNIDDVEKLNNAMIELFNIIDDLDS